MGDSRLTPKPKLTHRHFFIVVTPRCLSLENQLQRELNITRRVKRVGRRDYAEVSGARRHAGAAVEATDGVARHTKQRSICDIEAFRAELQLGSFRDVEILEDRQVHTYIPRHVERIVSFV